MFPTRALAFALGCFVFLGSAPAAGQMFVIPEAVERMRPKLCRQTPCEDYVTSRVSELDPAPFERVVRDSDRIVYGTLKKIGIAWGIDQKELFTDYELTPILTIADRPRPRTAPAGPAPIIVRQWGGQTIVNGINVRISDENFPFLPENMPVLLLLSYDTASGTHKVFDGGAGAFQVEPGGAVRHMITPTAPAYERFNGMPLSEVTQKIHQLRR